LRVVFQQYGQITSVQVVKEPVTGNSRWERLDQFSYFTVPIENLSLQSFLQLRLGVSIVVLI